MSKALDAYKLLSEMKCYDLSTQYKNNMPFFPGSPFLMIIPEVQTIEANGYYSQTLVLPEHAGSHVDAPLHTVPGAKAINEFPGNHFIAPYKKYAFSRFDPQPGQFLGMKEAKQLEAEDGFEPEEGDVILIQFGWSKHYHPEYKTVKERNWYAINEPGLDDEFMEYIASKKVRAVGFDNSGGEGPFIDGTPYSFNGHIKYFHPNEICIMENLIGENETGGMEAAPATGLFVAIPLPIDKGSGCPIRPLLFAEG